MGTSSVLSNIPAKVLGKGYDSASPYTFPYLRQLIDF